jgi:leader peptidase (prepilin peptidase) / N-methyltransferase
MAYIQFLFGAAIGSFLNVLAVRYDPDRFLFAEKVIGGRSNCPKCKKTLRWFELVPVLSYIIQGGKCRRCKTNISPQYLLVEILCGLIFVFVPLILSGQPMAAGLLYLLWILAFLILLLISLIDLRLFIIPDELTVALAALGIILGFLDPPSMALRVFSGLGAGTFFFLVFELYRSIRHIDGMGFGDVKLAAALGLLLGFPDIFIALSSGFVLGAIIGVGLIVFGKSGMKTAIPFGPFLALGALIALVGGNVIVAYLFEALVR